MENIKLISKTTIHVEPDPKNQPNTRIELTPWDVQILTVGPLQKGLLFHKPKSSSSVNHLKTSFSRTLQFFPPLAGRFATAQNSDGSITYFIDCNNSGAEFLHAVSHRVSIADIVDSTYVPDEKIYSFFPLNGVKNHLGTSNPLFAVQVTELIDGLFIGCSMNHALADGTTFWHFINSWSEISRDFDNFVTLSKLPSFDRSFLLSHIDLPVRIPVSVIQQFNSVSSFTPPPLKQRVFNFSKQNIGKLKDKVQEEIKAEKISSLQVVLSHMWRSVIRNRNTDPNQELRYLMVIGGRQRLKNPPMPDNYFGNSLQYGCVNMKAGEIVERGLGHVVLEMNNMVRMHTEDKLLDYLKNWKPVTMEFVSRNALATSSSPRFDVYGNDFGWGKPIAVRSGVGNKFDGKMTVFEGVEKGSIDVEACLRPETLERMEFDAEFIDYVTTGS